MPGLPITALYAALLGLVLLGLSVRVSQRCRVGGIPLGTGSDAELERRSRAQANFVEYVPLTLLLLALLEAGGEPGWVVHALGTALLAARVMHAIGMVRGAMTWRVLGASFTCTVLGVASAALLGLALPF